MKYTTEIEIDQPRRRVLELFEDPDRMPDWQPGLVRREPLEGQPGQPGATTQLVYQRDRREIGMIETLLSRSLASTDQEPHVIAYRYETEGVKNQVVNRFEALQGGRTRWVAENEFKFSRWMVVFAMFMGRAFRRQTRDDMLRFKAFVEQA